MKTFDVMWYARGGYSHTRVKAETQDEAIAKFYNMASSRVLVVDCVEVNS